MRFSTVLRSKDKDKNSINSHPQSQVWGLATGPPLQESLHDHWCFSTVLRSEHKDKNNINSLHKARYEDWKLDHLFRFLFMTIGTPQQFSVLNTKIRTTSAWGPKPGTPLQVSLRDHRRSSTVLRSEHKDKNNISSRSQSQGWGPEAGPPLQMSLHDHRRSSTALHSKHKDKNNINSLLHNARNLDRDLYHLLRIIDGSVKNAPSLHS